LLLLTNDSDFAQKLTHPSYEKQKTYSVKLDQPLTAQHLSQIKRGVELEDGLLVVDDVVQRDLHGIEFEVTLHSGRNRVVRRLFQHFGCTVITLDRRVFAGLMLGSLKRGSWRYLTTSEVALLNAK